MRARELTSKKLLSLMLIAILTAFISCKLKKSETKQDLFDTIQTDMQIEIIRYWFTPSIKLFIFPNSVEDLSTPNHQYLHVVLSAKNLGSDTLVWRTEHFKVYVEGLISTWDSSNVEYKYAILSPVGFPKSNIPGNETVVYHGVTGGSVKPGFTDTVSVSFAVPQYSTKFSLDMEGRERIIIHKVSQVE